MKPGAAVMPVEFRPYTPPPRTNLRERLIQQQAKRVRDLEESARVLQAERTTRLSPVEARLNAQYIDLIRAANVRLSNSLTRIAEQSAQEEKTESELRKLTPLERTSRNRGFYRSTIERNAAIAGVLQRERRQAAPLTREAYARAQAIAAARRSANAVQDSLSHGTGLMGARGYSYSPSQSDLFDPCVEHVMRAAVRREVMFAQRTAGRGYRGRHKKGPC